MDVEEGTDELTWDGFCAESVPLLWFARRDDRARRFALVALFATAEHFAAVGRELRTITSRQGASSTELEHLLHIAIVVARITNISHASRDRVRDASADHEHFIRWLETLCESFVEGELMPLPADWRTLGQDRPRTTVVEGGGPWRALWLDRLDPIFMSHAFAWIVPACEERLVPRELLLTCAENLARMVASRVSEFSEAGSDRAQPVHAELEIVRICAKFVVHEGSAETRRRVWHSLMSVQGDGGGDLGAAFVGGLFTHGIRDDGSAQPHFIATLHETLAFTIDARSGRDDADDELPLAFLGRYTVWDATRSNLVDRLGAYWRLWADAWLGLSTQTMEAFCTFLRWPAAAGLRLEAIGWIAAAMEGHHRPGRVAASAVALLEAAWSEHRDVLGRSGASRTAFEKLLAGLVAAGSPRAVLLSRQVAGDTG